MSIRDYAKTTISVTLNDDDFSTVVCALLEAGDKKLLTNLLIKRAIHELSFEEGGEE